MKNNPFIVEETFEEHDQELITEALEGNRQSLEKLVKRHQGWVFNIAVRMTTDFSAAEDVTQEILVKIITKLGTYDSQKGAFRTWLYRIVANHVTSLKRKNIHSGIPGGFNTFGKHMDSVPMEALPDESSLPCDSILLIEESKNSCMTAMLLCFTPKQRLVYILGEIFSIQSGEGAQILEMSAVNFRKILSRSRKQLIEFMNQKCGLVNRKATCRCEEKVMAHIRKGSIDPKHLKFCQKAVLKVKDLVQKRVRVLEQFVSEELQTLYQEHPFYQPADVATLFKRILDNPKYTEIFS